MARHTAKVEEPVSADELSDAGSTTCVDSDAAIDDSYVAKTLAREKPLPPITWANWHKNVQWVSFWALTLVPILSLWGALTTPLNKYTAAWAVAYYFYSGLGITAGYHRLWAHRSYNASPLLEYWLALAGAASVEGSIKWWSRGHRAHHRYTDTDLDPYNAHKGFWWSHVGWMIWKPRRKIGHADTSDLNSNPVVQWQHKFYIPLIFIMGLITPMAVAGLVWGDWRGGLVYAGACRLLFVHHSTFCVNSLAHWLGDAPFDDKHTPRDHFITALVTNGEGYHNFHHEYPNDYRNALKWFQYDPTRRMIEFCKLFGLASELKTFPDNEIKKGIYNQQVKKLREVKKTIKWPQDSNDLPILTWEQYQQQHKTSGRSLILVGGFIHDVTDFMEEHPGGWGIIKHRLGKDATTAFNGGVYDHSNGAHNLLSMLRVGVVLGGGEVESMKENPGVRVYDGPAADKFKHWPEGIAFKEELPAPLLNTEHIYTKPFTYDLDTDKPATSVL